MDIENYKIVVETMKTRSQLIQLIDALETQTVKIVDEEGKVLVSFDDDDHRVSHFLEYFRGELTQVEEYIKTL